MARTVPSVPHQPPNPIYLASGKPIRAGTASGGRLLTLGQSINLGLATGGAQPVVSQAWADGQASFAVGVSIVEQCRWRIPYLSELHPTVRCRVYAKDTAGAPKIRFSSVNAGNTADVSPAGGTFAWYQVDLDVAGGFGPHAGEVYEDITMSVQGSVDIQNVVIWYKEGVSGGTYPLADTLAAGPVDTTSLPIDDESLAADEALPSWLGHAMVQDLEDMEARVRVYVNTSAIESVALADGGEYIPRYPHRFVIPIQHLAGDEDYELTVWTRIENDDSADWLVYFDRGDGARNALYSLYADAAAPVLSPITVITAAATSGDAWQKTTIKVRRAPQLNRHPLVYAGMAHIGFVQQAQVSATSGLKSIAVWGK